MSFQYYLRGAENRSPDLFVATISGSSPKPNYIGSLAVTFQELEKTGLTVDWLLHQGDCHVDDARNACVAKFLQSGAPKMLFIDDDVGWFPEQFVHFVSHERDVVAGVYPQKSDAVNYPVRHLPPPHQAEADGLLQVEAVPTGFLLLSRGCLQKMAGLSKHFNREDTKSTPLIFERGIGDGDRRWSGDFWFSKKWREAGGTIWIDPDINLTHMGLKTWEGCYGDYLRQFNGIMDPTLDKALRLLQGGTVRSEIWEVIVARCGNFPYCAPQEMMDACYRMAKEARGHILEAGSGLTSVIMGMAVAGTGIEVHALEHDYKYLKKSRALLARYGLENVRLHYAPIKEEADGSAWYGIPDGLPESFDLVVCDGPPRGVADRKGLWRVMSRAIENADWIVDDVDGRPEPYEVNGRVAEVTGRFAVVKRPMRKVA